MESAVGTHAGAMVGATLFPQVVGVGAEVGTAVDPQWGGPLCRCSRRNGGHVRRRKRGHANAFLTCGWRSGGRLGRAGGRRRSYGRRRSWQRCRRSSGVLIATLGRRASIGHNTFDAVHAGLENLLDGDNNN